MNIQHFSKICIIVLITGGILTLQRKSNHLFAKSENILLSASTEKTTAIPRDWKEYSNPDVDFVFKYPNDWEIKKEYEYKSAACKMNPECEGIRVVELGKIGDRKVLISINLPQCSGIRHDALPGNNWICLLDDDPETLNVYEKIKESFRVISESNKISFLSPEKGEKWKIGEIHTIKISQPLERFYPFCHLILYTMDGKSAGIVFCKIQKGQTSFKWDTETLYNYCGCGLKGKYKKVKPGIYRIGIVREAKENRIIALSEPFSILPPQHKKDLKLSDFPEVFKENTLIVTGDNISGFEMRTVNGIVDYLEKKGYSVLVKKYSEIKEKDRRNYNLIIVGIPGKNPLLEEIYGMTDAVKVTDKYPGQYKGIIEILRNPWNKEKAVLLVEGSDGFGVEGAGERIKRESISVGRRSLIVKFSSCSKKIQSPILSKVFPDVKFYKAIIKPAKPPGVGIIGVYKWKEYLMPEDFNYLVIDCGIDFKKSNKIDLAKAFIIISNPALSEVSFSDFNLKDEDELKVRVKAVYLFETWKKEKKTEEEWRFVIKNNQFLTVQKKIVFPEREAHIIEYFIHFYRR